MDPQPKNPRGRPWQPSRAWSTSMAPRLLISCCHGCRRWIPLFPRLIKKGGNGGKLRRVFFFGEKQGVFCLKLSCRFIGVLTLLHLTQKLLIERFFSKDHSPWQALFFQEEEARARAMDLFFSFCEKISEGIKFGQDCIMRADMESPKEWLEIVQSPKHISYLLLEKFRTVTSDLHPQNCLLVTQFFHFRLL